MFQFQMIPWGYGQLIGGGNGGQQTLDTSITAGPSGGGSFRNPTGQRPNLGIPDSTQEIMNRAAIMRETTLSTLSYQIHILGEVTSPGTYQMSASNRLSEAIERSGGVLDRGSQRFIEIRRQGKPTKVVDLLAFKMFGNLNENPYLLDNDIIYVPLRRTVVQIVGPVKRPNVYELKNERNLDDLVKLAGGFASGASEKSPIRVVRFEEGGKRLLEVAQNDRQVLRDFKIQNADVVVVPHILTEKTKFDYNLAKLPGDSVFYPSYEDRVFILGAVYNPGPVPFNPYQNLRQYLTLAGGTNRMAKIRRIRVLATDGRVLKGRDDTPINPGDTIMVPERYLAPETWVGLTLGTLSAVLGITSTVLVLTR